MQSVAIVAPCFNEVEIIEDFIKALLCLPEEYTLVLVDDGSTDDTVNNIKKYPRIRLIQLEKNVGQQQALLRGLKIVRDYDLIITIDSDLQDDPTYINEMIALINSGYDYVAAVRSNRDSDSFLKRLFANMFYTLIKLQDKKVIKNHGDFRALRGQLVREYLQTQEEVVFLRGQLPRLAKNIGIINLKREKRTKGHTKYTPLKMMRLALDAFKTSLR
ncbi:glycosyltransferase family 2 protein [Bacteriovorax sp. Seq25_V]|uniref:glycosyltransferase family 2 protein n=1 Tax=Bacteriovorax sp. Seq25_V TaxID=1201288 RepID=UPI000389DCCE|nr:glycosyltransferase family 2 protein [Bacteriovorax sp. Seq25_V]EQC43285.1 glycosyltransferase, group 2 family protein [Bacteriovorax sp. Seq25_V]